jgi:aryl-alcohol dehydrogenase-like predicted oxidoreductase
VVPYPALASGFLTGKYRPDTEVSSARSGRAAELLASEHGRRVLAALDEVADARGVEPATVAVAWVAAQPTVVAPIASARTPEQLPPLLAAADLTLTQPELDTLNAASAPPSPPDSPRSAPRPH